MRTAWIIVAAFNIAVPAIVAGPLLSPVRNVYSEAKHMGATTFASFVEKAGFAKLLQDPRENLTVFAPTNVAFDHLSPDVRTKVESDPNFLKQFIAFHIVKGLQTLDKNNAVFQTMATNLGRVDIYSPDLTTVSGSSVLLADNPASNGVVDMLNRVMYPLPAGTALDLISGTSFSMLYLALTKAGNTSMFEASDITLFAPDNTAFQKLPPGVYPDLLEDVPRLIKVLQNHVVSRVVYSVFVEEKGTASLQSESGQNLSVTSDGSTLKVDTATVTSMDMNVNNGVVHVIDKVLLPPDLEELYGESSLPESY